MSSLTFIERPSPNFDARATGPQPEILILHYTGLPTLEESLSRLLDPRAKVSAHYLIDEEGCIFRLVDEADRAWHAGLSCWRGQSDINSLSLGIELQNPGHEWGLKDYPKPQMEALASLAAGIMARHDMQPQSVLAHSDVAPARKQDPGELFDWQFLAMGGVGIWHDLDDRLTALNEPLDAFDAKVFFRDLRTFGYDLDGQTTSSVVRAFQRHWRQALVTGQPDVGSMRALKALMRKLGRSGG